MTDTIRTFKGQVITRFGAELIIESDNHEMVRCTAKRKFDQIACGDFVHWKPAKHGNATIVKLLPRKNALTRPNYQGHLRTIAANIDQVIVVAAWLPEPFWPLIDRYLIATQQLNADAILVINKQDLAEENASPEDLLALKEYSAIGYEVLKTTTVDEVRGINALKEKLSDKTNIFVGQSGVGKSSLANLILPDADIRVGEISLAGEGKHTTTTTTLYHLEKGGSLIDSPGVRDFVLPNITEEQLRDGYQEFMEFAPYCRFNNCTHHHEPHCEVRKRVDSGELPPLRYQRYIKQLTHPAAS